MPLRHHDPFQEPSTNLDASVNPYVEKLLRSRQDKSLPIVFGKDLQTIKENPRSLFPPTAQEKGQGQLIVEVGCHLGKTINEMAADFPGDLFMGIDITYKRVVTTAERAVAQGNQNLQAIMVNAESLDQLFAPASIDGLVIFFPDPWPKAKHAKNRLMSPEFSDMIRNLVKPGGFLWFKTDADFYFAEACANLTAQGWLMAEKQGMFVDREYLSTFERKFRIKGQKTFENFFKNPDFLQ